MEDDSPWIGSTIRELALCDALSRRCGWHPTGQGALGFEYAPPLDYVIQPYEVLIIITPMQYFDEMRAKATGEKNKRPANASP